MEKTIKAIANYEVQKKLYPQSELNFNEIAIALLDDLTAKDELDSVDRLFLDLSITKIRGLKSEI